ncbi:hypothetical protein DE146DRAFT_772388, partial [Phaeosphaeria sp. MPI-PUGE-AT-0046c]
RYTSHYNPSPTGQLHLLSRVQPPNAHLISFYSSYSTLRKGDPLAMASSLPLSILLTVTVISTLHALVLNIIQFAFVVILPLAVWLLLSPADGRKMPSRLFQAIAAYLVLPYFASSLATFAFSNPWLRLIGTYVATFLSMDRYLRYKKSSEEASRKKKERERKLAEYLGEPVSAEKDVSGDEVKDIKGMPVRKAIMGPSTRRRG